MFKNKLLQLGVIILIALALITVVVVILMQTILDTSDPTDPNAKIKEKVENVDAKKYTPEEEAEMTVVMDEVLAQLASGETVMMAIDIQMDSVDAKSALEFSKNEIHDIVNQTMADLEVDDIKGSKGQDQLKTLLANKINPALSEGKIVKILIKKLIIA